MNLYVINGAIGAGKSTFIGKFLHEFELSDAEYINADYYVRNVFSDNKIDFMIRYNMAKKLREYKLNKAMLTGSDIIYEVVLAKISKLEFIKLCKRNGYHIVGIFIGVNDINTTINRVSNRANCGNWISIGDDKVINRYNCVMDYLFDFFLLSDEFIAFDNTGLKYELGVYKNATDYYFSSQNRWINDYLCSNSLVKEKISSYNILEI